MDQANCDLDFRKQGLKGSKLVVDRNPQRLEGPGRRVHPGLSRT
jgi:hypothetical protein